MSIDLIVRLQYNQTQKQSSLTSRHRNQLFLSHQLRWSGSSKKTISLFLSHSIIRHKLTYRFSQTHLSRIFSPSSSISHTFLSLPHFCSSSCFLIIFPSSFPLFLFHCVMMVSISSLMKGRMGWRWERDTHDYKMQRFICESKTKEQMCVGVDFLPPQNRQTRQLVALYDEKRIDGWWLRWGMAFNTFTSSLVSLFLSFLPGSIIKFICPHHPQIKDGERRALFWGWWGWENGKWKQTLTLARTALLDSLASYPTPGVQHPPIVLLSSSTESR